MVALTAATVMASAVGLVAAVCAVFRRVSADVLSPKIELT